ncbi:hypothetical protein Forpi1262_v017177 [Fusarium oxysporum f. sp. raphani]|uniref:Uncharacterized protein n=1 Tax=Fusarium oxysporum f. sp. raphani TaxID=96318 RepID=A0A8J5P817_FUSOX|nr:hypothetical protein Forpi1262_v017177 [Fusarium oxysporum f. sp. raphani]
MSTRDSEAASRRHYKINKTIKAWKTRDAAVKPSSPPEFTDLRPTFQTVLSENKVQPSDISKYVKLLRKAEERRAATACGETFEKMDKEIIFGLFEDVGPILFQEWFTEWKSNNQLAEDATPSNYDTQLSSEQTADDLHCIRESPAPQVGGKAPRKSFNQTFVFKPWTAENESSQPAQLTSSQPDEVEHTDELGCEPPTSRVRRRTKRPQESQCSKRRCIQRPRDTQVDDQYSSDQSEDTAPFTDDDLEACTGFCGDKYIENVFNGVSKDQVHQST